MFEYERIEKDSSIRITGYHGADKKVEVPDILNGLPVTEIGPYAFSGSDITLLDLPASIRRMGRYALYNCSDLQEFCFFNTLTDFGAGSFTGCHRIQKIRIEFMENETSYLRDVLMEIPEELLVEYHFHGKTASLLFPEYYEEGVENTPARIIESHTPGSGLLYRNCFVNRKLQFAEYDKRFPYAIGQEHLHFLFRLCMERLTYPYELTATAKEAYEKFLKEHFSQALDHYTAQKDQAAISFLMTLHHRKNTAAKLEFDL